MSKPVLAGSLALRLALIYAITVLGVVAVVGGGIYLITARYLTTAAEERLAELADFYAAYSEATATDAARLAALAPQIADFSTRKGGYDVRIFGRGGMLLAASRDLGPLPSRAALAALGGRRPTLFVTASYDGPGRMFVARPVVAQDGGLIAVIEVSRDQGEVEGFLDMARLVLAGAGVTALAASLAAGLLLVRQVARPVREVEAATRAIAAGDFERRLAIRRDDEIGRLAKSVNQMAADLARLEAARRDFIARISHDLRTPLTAIKGLAINMQDAAPEEMVPALVMVDEQTDRLIRLVDDLLTLSRLQRAEMRLRRERVDLGDVARSVAALALPQSERRGVSFEVALDPAAEPVVGDADRLQQVVVNLVDNALRVTEPGGHVRMTVEPRVGETALVVTDDGPGLSEEEAARAFEPYARGVGGGAGLGLTIAREIVAAHGGRIWLRARDEGGAEAGFALPASTDRPPA
jgi:signal transduction histidine kinase